MNADTILNRGQRCSFAAREKLLIFNKCNRSGPIRRRTSMTESPTRLESSLDSRFMLFMLFSMLVPKFVFFLAK